MSLTAVTPGESGTTPKPPGIGPHWHRKTGAVHPSQHDTGCVDPSQHSFQENDLARMIARSKADLIREVDTLSFGPLTEVVVTVPDQIEVLTFDRKAFLTQNTPGEDGEFKSGGPGDYRLNHTDIIVCGELVKALKKSGRIDCIQTSGTVTFNQQCHEGETVTRILKVTIRKV